jgi:hypothetical protein
MAHREGGIRPEGAREHLFVLLPVTLPVSTGGRGEGSCLAKVSGPGRIQYNVWFPFMYSQK